MALQLAAAMLPTGAIGPKDSPRPADNTTAVWCFNTCMDFAPTGQLESLANNGFCQDGGEGSVTLSPCPLGTDCDDCGPRAKYPPSPWTARLSTTARLRCARTVLASLVAAQTRILSAMIGAPLTTMERVSRLSSDAWMRLRQTIAPLPLRMTVAAVTLVA